MLLLSLHLWKCCLYVFIVNKLTKQKQNQYFSWYFYLDVRLKTLQKWACTYTTIQCTLEMYADDSAEGNG